MARRLRSVLGSAPRRGSAKACKASPRACTTHRRIEPKRHFAATARDTGLDQKEFDNGGSDAEPEAG